MANQENYTNYSRDSMAFLKKYKGYPDEEIIEEIPDDPSEPDLELIKKDLEKLQNLGLFEDTKTTGFGANNRCNRNERGDRRMRYTLIQDEYYNTSRLTDDEFNVRLRELREAAAKTETLDTTTADKAFEEDWPALSSSSSSPKRKSRKSAVPEEEAASAFPDWSQPLKTTEKKKNLISRNVILRQFLSDLPEVKGDSSTSERCDSSLSMQSCASSLSTCSGPKSQASDYSTASSGRSEFRPIGSGKKNSFPPTPRKEGGSNTGNWRIRPDYSNPM